MIEQVIEKVRDPKHWSKGKSLRITDGVTSRCLGAAIEDVVRIETQPENNAKLYKLVSVAIRELYPNQIPKYSGGPIGIVVRFNDNPDTVHADIMKVLERAKELEAKKK